MWVNFVKPVRCNCGLTHKGAECILSIELYWFNCACDSTLTSEKENNGNYAV